MKRIIFLLLVTFVGCQEKDTKISDGETLLIPKNEEKNFHTEENDIIEIDTLIDTDKYLAIGNKNAELKINNKKDSLKYPSYNVAAWDDDILIIGKNLNVETLEIYKKFNPSFSFSDFEVPVYSGELASPNFDKFPDAKRYITRITEECKKGINFAGKYTLVIWGCGSPCQGGVIVDRLNGDIYFDYFSTFGSDFKKDSKLVIFNSGMIDKKNNLMNFTGITEVRTEIWENNKFKKLKIFEKTKRSKIIW